MGNWSTQLFRKSDADKKLKKAEDAAAVAQGMKARAARLPSEDAALSRKKHKAAAAQEKDLKSKRAKAGTGYDGITAAVRKMPGLAKFPGGQKAVDKLAKKLGLKAGKDFRNYSQMKNAILKALKGGETRKPAYAKKPMSGDPQRDSLDATRAANANRGQK